MEKETILWDLIMLIRYNFDESHLFLDKKEPFCDIIDAKNVTTILYIISKMATFE